MSENSNSNTKIGSVIKIIIPVVILCILVGLWFIKNNRNHSGLDETVNSGTLQTGNSDYDLDVTEKIDLEKLKSFGLPIVIDFGADSCIPCKQMAPVLKELNEELKGKAIIKFVDVWKYQELAQGYPISLIPTQILIDSNGKPYKPKDPNALQIKEYKSRETGEHIFTAHEGGITKEQLLSVLKEMGLK
ncbi:thioredoxin family protein [Pseudobacteroides cellulosolvens]|uniref:Thioredoxin domain-containing protein n=1 Tax=Pseudobacteroides cellulosolvens ATCC 35603 = DSM 2933 TaxID=398512 RepID=A0A0L6JWS7_9FIRM|nr:thioredoxin family protein [Pseudobacteroides cellulosolvens]KNY30298.1 Thioredoxin domain-containing protein [Pseudobacteroides cellulosolvens ATCC 35603 = DSM 2933]